MVQCIDCMVWDFSDEKPKKVSKNRQTNKMNQFIHVFGIRTKSQLVEITNQNEKWKNKTENN